MEAWKKEVAFERASRAGNVSNGIWKYIPKKFYSAVSDCSVDSDGYWVYLNKGWTAYDHDVDCGIIHEYTIADLKAAIKTIACS